MLKAVEASKPAPDPAQKACEEAFHAKQKASSQRAKEAPKNPIPGFDPNAANFYKYAPPPC
jgi:hypothetical protein